MLEENCKLFTTLQKKNKPDVKKISGKKIFPLNPSMNITKLKKII